MYAELYRMQSEIFLKKLGHSHRSNFLAEKLTPDLVEKNSDIKRLHNK
jgi:hypothetical protein